MTPPRWFFPLVAACLVALTAAGVWWAFSAGRYVMIGGERRLTVLDTRTGRVCTAYSEMWCRDYSKPGKVTMPAEPQPQTP